MMTQSYFEIGSATAGDCTYTNEGQLHRALLPERFQSTSTPEYPYADLSEISPVFEAANSETR
jgi:hypothetical protein